MFEDLRGYLTHLESQGQLLRVAEPVEVKYEIAAGMRKTSDIEGPAAYLASDASIFHTGDILVVDGGRTVNPH